MPTTSTSREAYYQQVLSGRATTQSQRIMRFLLQVGRPVTRHEVVDRFFCVYPGPRALDGGLPIPWNSAGPRITALMDGGYVAEDHVGPCPVTGAKSQFLVPVGDEWANRRLF